MTKILFFFFSLVKPFLVLGDDDDDDFLICLFISQIFLRKHCVRSVGNAGI